MNSTRRKRHHDIHDIYDAHDPAEHSPREHPRYAHEATVTLHTPGHSITGSTRNLSRGGLCATLAEEVAVGSDIDLDLRLMFGDRQSEPLRLRARIAWCTAIDDYYQIGMQFRALHRDTAAYLTMLLRFLGGRTAIRPTRTQVPVDERFG